MTQKVIKVGSSLAVVIPKEIAQKNNIKAGSIVDFTEAKKGQLVYTTLKTSSTLNNEQTKVANIAMDFINRYRKDLEALKDK
ncbi:MAG TPA: AbrB/MazE/SpoVT family DNA-binding domain-containing protein [Candidatus Paceibacterota bacterium]|nr:AbrB/MazE/SpoVT family DNA-binding domain-containing protein [Candidatus Paceibacterota bacterium]